MKRGGTMLLALGVVVGGLALGAAPALAGSASLYASTTGAGTTCSAGAPCTLTEALSTAATAESGNAVTIIVEAGTYSGSFSIASGTESQLELLGEGAGFTVLDGGGSQTLSITAPFFVDIQDLTLENGVAEYGDNLYADSGHAIDVQSDVLSGGGDGGSDGSLDVNGGSTLSVANSTIDGDVSAGLVVLGAATVTFDASTLSGNAGGGMIVQSGFGSGSVSVGNSTIAGNGSNSPGEAGILDYGVSSNTAPVDVFGSTISGNGAAGVQMYSPGNAIELGGDILADNRGDAGANCLASYGTITDEGYNYSDDASCSFTGTSHGSEPDAALGLGALANNGGLSDTESITSASVAYDVVPDGVTLPGEGPEFCNDNYDERGVPRDLPGSTACDAGAYQVATPITYFASAGGGVGACTVGAPCSLTTALGDAAAAGDDGFAVTIDLAAGTYATGSSTILLNSGSEFSLAIDGAGAGATIINGAGTTTGTLDLEGTPFGLTLENLSVENGTTSFYGDNVLDNAGGPLTLIDDAIGGGGSSNEGGVAVLGGVLTVDGSTITDPDSTGIEILDDSTGLIEDSTLTGSTEGGAAAAGNSVATIDDSTITGGGPGSIGVASASNATLRVYGSTIAGSAGYGVEAEGPSNIKLGGDVFANDSQGDCISGGGTLGDEGYNFGDDGSCGFVVNGNGADSTLAVGALASKGGPAQTMPITSASGAYDVIPVAATLLGQSGAFCAGADERGVARTQGSATACDAGAYQYAPPIVTSLSASLLDLGLPLTLSGSRLGSVTSATFGSALTPASISNQGETSLALALPLTLSPGSEQIALTNLDGTTDVAFSALADPVVSTNALPAGQVGSPYSQTLGHAGGIGAYTFTLASGSLPAGLSLSSAGVIAGTPTGGAGASSFTVRVSDGDAVTSPSQALSITVAAAPSPVIAIAGSKIKLKAGKGPIGLTCAGAPCAGTVTITKTVHRKVKGHRKTTIVTLASGSYSTTAGAGATVTLTLTAKGRAAFAHAAKHPLGEALTATVSGGASISTHVTVT
jgi:hypothetical protein